ncbi:MAG: aldehyde ferredoxin oxidoreductase [Desulfarculus sp.]|jgi:aldehyde:ferredoxin oxidoreductase|nr:MAG: aldehyde ferredoxin oxidoreductase [Desulfarculus sp.]
MPPGYKGQLLHIDLGTESSQAIALPEEVLHKYIGGRALGAKLYWDLIPPEAHPLGPDNVFMVLTGPLTGTMAPCGCKHLIVTKSPASGGWLETYSSGRIAPELKFAGYDGLLITGKAKRPSLLFIQDDKVSFQDAGHLWGQGSFATETYLKQALHPECGCLSIGPAGENLIKFACVGSDYFRKAGRGGAGAVMGAKNLKGLAIKGSGGVGCADLPGLYALIKKHYEVYKQSPIANARHKFGTPLTLNITHAAGMLPTRNFSRGQFEAAIGTIDKDGVAKATVADRACYGCFLACSKITQVDEGVFAGTKLEGPEYETIGMLGSNLEIDYLPAIIKANYICDDLGMDTISAGVIIGFAMECYERGLISKRETGGLELKFGNYLAAVELLELMGRKQGFGAFCTLGVRDMARLLGREAETFAMHSKGMEFPAYDPRAGWGSTITYSTTPRGGCHRRAWPPMKEVLGGVNPFTAEGKAELVVEMMNENSVMHSLVVCDFPGKFIPLKNPDWAEYLGVVTGQKFTAAELEQRAEVAETLVRRINIREGFTVEQDRVPRRILHEALPSGPPEGKIIGEENFLKMRSAYYALRGWDEQGLPTPETLARCGFEQEPRISLEGAQ